MILQPRTGQTRTGLPVSINAAPAEDLAGCIARYFVTIIDQPEDQVTEDFVLNETAMVRVLVRGSWEAYLSPRGWTAFDGPLLFGAQRRAMRVRVRGPMATAGFAIRPSGWPQLDSGSAGTAADKLVRIAGDWGSALALACVEIDDHRGTIAALESAVRDRARAIGGTADATMVAFETLARVDPTISIGDAATGLGLTTRQLDRQVRHHFGHLPKTVLRRSRFLDMAAVMRGLAVPDADALARLRFYDASHLNHEFRLFIDMAPSAFERAPTPLFTPGLEVRQQRKLRDLAKRGDQETAPWLADPHSDRLGDDGRRIDERTGVRDVRC